MRNSTSLHGGPVLWIARSCSDYAMSITGTTTVPFVECYDGKTNSWKRVTDMNINRSALGACVAINLPNSREFSIVGEYSEYSSCSRESGQSLQDKNS